MSDFDHEHVSHLLNIVAQCAGHSGKLGAISNEAMHELMELNDKMHIKGTERRKQAEAKAAEKKAIADQASKEPVEETVDVDEDTSGTTKPSVFPADSRTATIADRRI